MRKLLFLTIQNPSLQKLCDVGIQCSHQPLTLKSTAIQTEFEDATMSARVSTKSPPPTQANATTRQMQPKRFSYRRRKWYMNSFSTQPNQFEPRRNSNESESNNESMSGEEGMEENTNYVYVTEYLMHCKY